jgi:hypothetical protein
MFLIYLFVIPAVYYLIDRESMTSQIRTKPLQLIAAISGISLAISLVIAFWLRRDPELRKY